MREFLEKNRAEAKAMSIYEYDQEEHIRLEREDAFEDGRKEGISHCKKFITDTKKKPGKAEVLILVFWVVIPVKKLYNAKGKMCQRMEKKTC